MTDNGNGKIRMIALDLDGTVLTDDKRLTARTADAIQRATDAGVEIVIATGRPLSGIPDDVMAMRDIRYVITSNGAITTDLRENKTLRAVCVNRADAKEIVQLPMERGLVHSVFIGGTGYCEPSFYEQQIRFFGGTKLSPYVRKSRRETTDIRRLIDSGESGVENIWMITRDRAERDRLNAYIRERWAVRTVLTAVRDIEIGHPEADKGLAMHALAQTLGIGREAIMAIGDNENDIGMFRHAGVSVSMGNGTDGARQAAMVIADTNEEDGVAKIIASYIR